MGADHLGKLAVSLLTPLSYCCLHVCSKFYQTSGKNYMKVVVGYI